PLYKGGDFTAGGWPIAAMNIWPVRYRLESLCYQKDEILQSLRSFRMTGMKTFASGSIERR
ncbi:MAG: hypothetical protein NTW80_03395, partial [Deltaproteobacteria bacterium]|nr:hypothetical protein [Deltaproteobacteria bacterium]